MTKYDITVDISTITSIPKFTLDKLSNKISEDICHCVLESNLNGEDTICADIGFGSLMIQVSNSEVSYKFIPSKKFESMLVKTINEKSSPLVKELEDNFAKKIIQLYKDLL